MNKALLDSLRACISGEVYADELLRAIYATDASHYQLIPQCVVIPRDVEDCLAALRIASEHAVPITPRGGGTSLSGQTTWTGMVLDCSKYLNRILELNLEQGWVRVQPGVVRDELNQWLAPHRVHFAPDPATGNRANVGGMIGNNSSGTRSLVYGKTIDHVLECTVALADGTVLQLKPMPDEYWRTKPRAGDRLAEISWGVTQIIDSNQDEIRRRFPKVMRRVSGYNLDAFLPESEGGQPGPWNLTHLIVGSEGTLALLLEAKLKLTPLPPATGLCIVHFADLIDSLRAVVPILEHRPSAVELLDHDVIREARQNRTTAPLADFLLQDPQAVLIVEFFGESTEEVTDKLHTFASKMQVQGIGCAWPIRSDPAGIARVWEVRKLGLGLISNRKGPRKGIEFIEDACVPVEVLPQYIERVMAICAKRGLHVTAYAHASVGVLHVRPNLDLHEPGDIRLMKEIADEVFQLVLEYGGSWSSEHGDGLLRGEYIPRFYGPRIYEAFRQVKKLFDPQGLMNPGKIIDAEPMTSHLRFDERYAPQPPPSRFHYKDQGGFVLAVEQCNGVGACRKTGAGTMCPSYMATRDEQHSTRGRANALRMAMSGQLGPAALTSDRMLEVLDLCLSCKACKTECPNNVDMSRLKADVLQWRYQRQGTPWSARCLAAMPRWLPLATGPWAGLLHALLHLPWVRAGLQRFAGIDPRRPLPKLARQTLERWFPRRSEDHPSQSDLGTVLLFCDTFTNYFEPHVGQAAVRLLEACGYRVQLAMAGCCQRMAISKGLLDHAARDGERTLRRLQDQLRQSKARAVLVLEPSCASALADDLPDLIPDDRFEDLQGQVQLIDLFLAREFQEGRLPVDWYSDHSQVLVHGHCHQKALFGTDAMKLILSQVSGLHHQEIDSGCCGMAGAFGYEHHDLSQKIGEDRLFPAIRARAPGTQIVACGISCRHQIHDFLGVQAHHWVEVVQARRRDNLR